MSHNLCNIHTICFQIYFCISPAKIFEIRERKIFKMIFLGGVIKVFTFDFKFEFSVKFHIECYVLIWGLFCMTEHSVSRLRKKEYKLKLNAL